MPIPPTASSSPVCAGNNVSPLCSHHKPSGGFLYFKLGFIGELGLRTFLSVAKEKYQKNRHVRKGPRSFPYGSYPLSGAAFLPGAKRLYARVLHGSPAVRNLGGAPSSRVSPVRGDDSMGFLFLLRVSGEVSADGAPPFVRALCCPRPSAQSDLFAPAWAKGSRT